jgi:hypothetical protein
VTSEAAAVAVIDALERLGIPYMVVGSLASNFHGIPRSTRDADFVVELGPSALSMLAHALPADLHLQPQGAFEAVTGTIRHVVAVKNSPFVCELFECGDDAHDRERLRRRWRVQMFGRTAHVATAEDMVVTKLRWATLAHRTKDEDDVRNILAVRAKDLDWAYVRRWCEMHGTLARLEAIRATLPPSG